jgi:multicomponent Na+:H+ antiporter subunit D
MVAAAVAGLVPGLVPGIERAAAQFHDQSAYTAAVLAGRSPLYPPVATAHVTASAWIYSLIATGGAFVAAAVGLRGRHVVPARLGDVLHAAHSGHIGDYIAWWTFGMSVLGGLLLWAVAG